jgi:hypothetical protein
MSMVSEMSKGRDSVLDNLASNFDALFTAQRLKILFKNSKEDTTWDIFFNVIDWPFNFLRNYTIPPGSLENWDRRRMAVCAVTFWFVFSIMFGIIDDVDEDMPKIWVCLGLTIFGIGAAVMILLKTKATAPPEWLRTLSSIICFVMSIAWIAFVSDNIVDLL